MKAIATKAIRVLTVAPVMALATLITLFAVDPTIFGGTHKFILSVFFLFILPILAYPLQPFIPKFKDRGREGQRNLAMIFAIVGYVAGVITNLFLSAGIYLWLIYLDYLISGAVVVIINKVFKIRASAHACGIVGPGALLCYFGIPAALIPTALLYAGAMWASVSMKRHTVPQFIGGAIIPLATLSFLNFATILLSGI